MQQSSSNLKFMAEYYELREKQAEALQRKRFGLAREDDLVGRACDFQNTSSKY